MVITTSCSPHALLQRDLAAAPWRGGVSPCPFTVQILWLLGPANHGGNDVVPILGIALYWSSIFWLLPLGSQPSCKHVTSLTLPQAQAAKRGLGEWDIMWRSQGAPWCCPRVRKPLWKWTPSSGHPTWCQREQRKLHSRAFPKFLSSRIAGKMNGCLMPPSSGVVCNVAIDSWNTV